MSTQVSQPRLAPASPLPGMALVRRLDGPIARRSAVWMGVLVRLCFYSLPGVVGLLLHFPSRVAGVEAVSELTDARFILLFTIFWIAALELLRATAWDGLNQEHTGAMAVLQSACISLGASLLLLRLPGLRMPDLKFCAEMTGAVVLASVAVKAAFRLAFTTQNSLPRVMVAVAGARGAATLWKVAQREVSRHEISGAIRLEDIGENGCSAATLSTEELARELHRQRVEGVLISAPASELAELTRKVEACGGLGAPARFVVGPREGFLARDVARTESLYLFNAGAAPAETINYTIFKRAFDIVFSLGALIALSPLLLSIAAAIKLTSRGPVFFRQDRVGWNGRVFRMIKFRTMRSGPAREGDTLWTVPGDPRCTRIGALLRRFSLDELPQFFNALMGEMSVVGPRPERPYFVSSFRRQIDEYQRRHQLKVGITGWAQVNGLRGDTCIRTRLMYDLYYLQNWGLVFDLKIILRTVFCVFSARNAY
jgi:exopolysaccharide biosynthesis polyprenyl glycosylphosphotransferase